MAKLNIGLIFGGKSGEHEVSLESAKSVYETLNKKKYRVSLIFIDKSGKWSTEKDLEKIDVFFPVIHGTYGEDGCIQGFLELLNAAYVGSGVIGSAIGMDKDVQKRLLRDAGILTAKFISVEKIQLNKRLTKTIIQKLKFPLFVKPANLGSSVGVSKVDADDDLHKAIEEAFRYDNKILIEEGIAGREIECSVLGNDKPVASLPGEVLPKHEFYSYEAKYIDENGAVLKIPAKLSKNKIEEIRKLAVKVFRILECSGMARVDFFLEKSGKVIVNEINTIPGFTKISMYPKLWEISGIPYRSLLDKLISLALENKRKKDRLQRDFRI